MTGRPLLSLLQFTDGLFPIGAYAHSFGLETYVQGGQVQDAAGAEAIIRSYLSSAIAHSDAVAAVNALDAAEAQDAEACRRLDDILEAMKTPSESRQASRQFGRQTLEVATAILDDPFAAEFHSLVDRQLTPGHHAVAHGIVGAAQGWRRDHATRAYLYSCASTMTAAAVRLIPLGQIRGQIILANLLPLIDSLVAEVERMSIFEMSSFAPALEIASMRHAQLEGRLCRS
jgi:urease accessory protein